jgi:hypothetical protein
LASSGAPQEPWQASDIRAGNVEYPGLFLLNGDVIVEDLDDAIEVSNE